MYIQWLVCLFSLGSLSKSLKIYRQCTDAYLLVNTSSHALTLVCIEELLSILYMVLMYIIIHVYCVYVCFASVVSAVLKIIILWMSSL